MVWSRFAIFFFFIILCSSAYGQKNRYMVFFKDKSGTPFSLSAPLQFLSQKAIERRIKHNISIDESDLPVNPSYIDGVKNAGAEVYFTTRWMNGLLIQCEENFLPTLQGLSFVKSVELVAPNASLVPNGRVRSTHKNKSNKSAVTDAQLQMLGIDKMHNDGFWGDGVTIAILDAGFAGVKTADAFNHLITENRIEMAASRDFVYNSNDVFQYDDHGTEVFSVIAAQLPGSFTGGVPEATFQLYVTEEVPTEYRVEEYNWLFAAERADSAGADIIQSSLGYNDFDGTAFDYQQSQMDGNTAVVSRAAQMAADRGLVIVVSAGNEGSVSWQIITAPADAEGVLAVGSVNVEEVRSPSSSIGPSADNRIKPDVAAMGVNTSVINVNGNIDKSSGTSLAAPLITSLMAGIVQKYPDLTNTELMDAVRNSASQAFNPDKYLGYGIPRYERIVEYLDKTIDADFFAVYPNPTFVDSITIRPLFPEEVVSCSIEIITLDGKIIYNLDTGFSKENRAFMKSLTSYSDGLYFVRIKWQDKVFVYRFVKA
jgi:serine protease AprX